MDYTLTDLTCAFAHTIIFQEPMKRNFVKLYFDCIVRIARNDLSKIHQLANLQRDQQIAQKMRQAINRELRHVQSSLSCFSCCHMLYKISNLHLMMHCDVISCLICIPNHFKYLEKAES